jgi:hypothetical protein
MRQIVFFATTALLLLPRLSLAQDTPRLGIVMGYPAEVAVLWNVSSRVAVRPEINWTRSRSETTLTTSSFTFNGTTIIPTTVTTTSTSDSWQIGVGVSGLFYLSKSETLRTYVSPRYVYSRSTGTSDLGVGSVVGPITTEPVTTVITNHAASGSLGAQYEIGKRFGVFGELGVSYLHSGDRSSSQPSSVLSVVPSLKSWTIGLRSGVGVILFFGQRP